PAGRPQRARRRSRNQRDARADSAIDALPHNRSTRQRAPALFGAGCEGSFRHSSNLRHHNAKFPPPLRWRLWYALRLRIIMGGVSVMSGYAPYKAGTIVPFAPTPKGQQDTGAVVDDSGRTIVALLQKAADMANEDCKRAMDLAHKLSFQLRASEERLRDAEAEAAHFRDRAARAEAWLVRIHNEVEQMFFPKRERDPNSTSRQ